MVEYDPEQFKLNHAEAVTAIIELKGYAVEPVRADPAAGVPPYAYTIGIEDLLGHPELCAFGLDGELTSRLFDEFVEHLLGGGELPVGQAFVGMLGRDDLPCILLPVDVASTGSLFSGAADYFSHRPFRMLQLVYPDAAGRFPWDDDVDPGLLTAQWVIADPGGAA